MNAQFQAEEENVEPPDPRKKTNAGSAAKPVTGRTIAEVVDVAAHADAADPAAGAPTPETEHLTEAEEEVEAEAVETMEGPKSLEKEDASSVATRAISAETAPTPVEAADPVADTEVTEETVKDATEEVADTRLPPEVPDPDLLVRTADLLTAAAVPVVDAETLVPALPPDVETTLVPGLLVVRTETAADPPVTTE